MTDYCNKPDDCDILQWQEYLSEADRILGEVGTTEHQRIQMAMTIYRLAQRPWNQNDST